MEKNWQIITSKASLNPRRRESIASTKRMSSNRSEVHGFCLANCPFGAFGWNSTYFSPVHEKIHESGMFIL